MLTINMTPNALKQQFLIKIELITALKALKSPCTLPFFWYLFTFIGLGGRVMLLPSILVYTNFHSVYEMYVLRKFRRKPSCHEPYCLSVFCSNSTK